MPALARNWPWIAACLLLLPTAGCVGRSGGLDTSGNLALVEGQNVDDASLTEAARLIDEGRGRRAFRKLVDRFQDRPQAPAKDVALYLAANALIDQGRRLHAFFYLEQLLDEHPDSALYLPAAQKQYDIGESYLDGEGDRFLFFPVHQEEEAVEMLFRVQQRVPGSQLAEQALKRTADHYYLRGDYDFAEDAYGVFIDRFPRSPRIATVRLLQAYSNLLQYEGPSYDPTPLLDAATQLRQFAAEFPQLAREQAIGEKLAWIDEQLARKLMIEADFYRRTSEPRASQLLLAEVVERHPDTPQAQRARRRLAAGAPPATSPSTRPAGDAREESGAEVQP